MAHQSGTHSLQLHRKRKKNSALSDPGESEGLSPVQIQLETGRSHQIRVQLASRQLPWGDQRYNPKARPGQQIAWQRR
ncbi:MAG: hypothetical protein ACLSA6_06840 [Holdemania massiliensis]